MNTAEFKSKLFFIAPFLKIPIVKTNSNNPGLRIFMDRSGGLHEPDHPILAREKVLELRDNIGEHKQSGYAYFVPIISDCRWLKEDKSYREVFIELLGNVAALAPHFTIKVFEMLVSGFVQKETVKEEQCEAVVKAMKTMLQSRPS